MTIFAKEEKRLTVAVRLLAAAFLLCLGLSWKLWISSRLYPLVPLFGLLPPLPSPFDHLALAAVVGLLAGIVVWPRATPLIVAVVVMLSALFAQDQSRLWPSFYEFFILFLLLLSWRPDGGEGESQRLLAGMRFVVAAVYFWGGVQKLTPHFFHEEFPWFIQPLTDLVPVAAPCVPALAVAAAIGEVMIGVGLLTRRCRSFALGEALVMHAIIFVCIGPIRGNWNDAAWMWSLATAALAWVLFYDAPPFSFRTMFAAPWRRSLPQMLAVALVGVAPVLNNVNRWDSAMSFNVYTGNVTTAAIVLPADAVGRLPPEVAAHVTLQGAGALLDVNAWAREEFSGGAYPETRIFRAVFRMICGLVPDRSLRLVIIEKASWSAPKTQRMEACGEM
jgi:hypothetical protein